METFVYCYSAEAGLLVIVLLDSEFAKLYLQVAKQSKV